MVIFIRPTIHHTNMSLYDAAYAGDLTRVMQLVEQGADKNDVNVPFEVTALYIAAERGHLAVVRYLVEQKADMEQDDEFGWTPLFTASVRGHLEVVRYLLEQGANRDKINNCGLTSLHFAAGYGHLEITKLLMVYGADLNARDHRGHLPIDVTIVEEIKQAIRDEPRRRMDEAPGKRATVHDRHCYATAASASTQQENEEVEEVEQDNMQPAEDGEGADEDPDSELSSDEEDSN